MSDQDIAEAQANIAAWKRARSPKPAPSMREAVEAAIASVDASRLPTEAEVQRRERELHGDTRLARLSSSGIRPRLEDGDAGIILRGPRVTPSFARVEAWVWQLMNPEHRSPTWGPWLWLGGPRGIGKTLAAAWAIAEVGGRYVTMRGMMLDQEREQRRRAGLLYGRDAGPTFAARYGVHALVVLDELGQEEPEGGTREAVSKARGLAKVALHEFVDHRKGKTTPTIVLTNKSAASIRQRFSDGTYDQRTESRLRQLLTRDKTTRAGLHDVGGDDLRGESI